jgi:hypothetical protein
MVLAHVAEVFGEYGRARAGLDWRNGLEAPGQGVLDNRLCE